MKFRLDENLGTLGKDLLEADGHDVMTVSEQRLSGTPDEQLFDICRDEKRALVTLDHDFGQTLRFPPEKTAGVVVLECGGRQSPAVIIARVEELVLYLRDNSVEGRLWILEPGRLRIHAQREDR